MNGINATLLIPNASSDVGKLNDDNDDDDDDDGVDPSFCGVSFCGLRKIDNDVDVDVEESIGEIVIGFETKKGVFFEGGTV